MAVWLDIIGSFIFGSLLALNVMQLNANITEQSYKSSLTYIAQSSAVTIADIVEEDFQKMGYGVADTAITLADTSQIRFLVDLSADGSIDTLYYYLGSTSDAGSTPNPSDRVIYRVLNGGTPQGIRLGETVFRLSYFNAQGDSLVLPVTPGDIRQIRVDLTVESRFPYNENYAKAFMQLRIFPKNIEP